MSDSIIDNLTNITVLTNILWLIVKSIFAVIIGFAAIKFSRYYFKKILNGWKNHLPPKKVDTIQSMLLSAVKYIIYFVVFFTVLNNFGVSAVSMIMAGIGSVAIGFASQSLVKDVIMGASILITDSFSIGDILTIGACTGKVESLGIRSTKIRAMNGDLHIIPNSEIKIITRIHIDENNKHLYQFPSSESQDETVDKN